MWDWFFDGTWGSYLGFTLVALMYIVLIFGQDWLATLVT